MDYTNLTKRNILAIDIKSFFASCECIERGLDPFKYPLVVANPKRNGSITLAVTPFLKEQGVPSRTRLYKIPKNIKYKIVPPRMSLYVKKSKEVVGIYQSFISIDDIHIYSIDECFLDVTDYLKMYKKTDLDLAKEIIKTVKEKTGLTVTCGIGPNILIAKVAMDIEAKKSKDFIAKWTYDDIESKFFPITPLSKFWGIGKRMERNLNLLKIYSIKDLAYYDKSKLIKKFGIMGEELYNHAWGIDLSLISDFKNHKTKDKSIGQSQVLFKDYNDENIKIIIKEMVYNLAERLRRNHKNTTVVSLGIRYSKNYGGGFYHSRKLDSSTHNIEIIYKMCLAIFNNYYDDAPIRSVSISLGGLVDNNIEQLSLFEDYKEKVKTDSTLQAVDSIKKKYGKNSIIKASNLLKDSTAIERNKKLGGHNK